MTTPQGQVPEALQIANALEREWKADALNYDTALSASAELRRLHALTESQKELMDSVTDSLLAEYVGAPAATPSQTAATPSGAAYADMDYEHQRAIMEGERNASLAAFDHDARLSRAEERIYETAFGNGWDRRASHGQAPSQPTAAGCLQHLTTLQEQAGMYADDFTPSPQAAQQAPQVIRATNGIGYHLSADGNSYVHADNTPTAQQAPAAQEHPWGCRANAFGACSCGQAPVQPDFTTLGAAIRAIRQAIELIGEPADDRMRNVRRVLRGAVIVSEDSGELAVPPADAVVEGSMIMQVGTQGFDLANTGAHFTTADMYTASAQDTALIRQMLEALECRMDDVSDKLAQLEGASFNDTPELYAQEQIVEIANNAITAARARLTEKGGPNVP